LDIVHVDDREGLYVSSEIDDWDLVRSLDIRVIVDLEGGLDYGVPTVPGSVLYIYLPMHDHLELPNLVKMDAVAAMCADLYRKGYRILSHCGMGLNRSPLMAGRILNELGWRGPAIVERLQTKRPGALYNEVFCEYVRGLTD